MMAAGKVPLLLDRAREAKQMLEYALTCSNQRVIPVGQTHREVVLHNLDPLRSRVDALEKKFGVVSDPVAS